MNGNLLWLRDWISVWISAWNEFWFQRRDPATLGLIRIFTGLLVLYSQYVWGRELLTFFGPNAALPAEYRSLLFENYAWSHFDWVTSATAMWTVHWIGLVVVALFTLGCWSRVTSVLTAMLVISYCNRATGTLFGLDQLLAMLCLYLAIGNCGGAFSIDRWWQQRKSTDTNLKSVNSDVPTNIATRLIQLHLCLIYFFAGLGKLQGETWWNGQAIWFSVASYEYQTWDLTWLADHLWLANLLTLVTVFWEVTYPALVWSRLTRPVVLAIAVLTHLGIGLAMGMMTFGLVMLVANVAFVEPEWLHRIRRQSRF